MEDLDESQTLFPEYLPRSSETDDASISTAKMNILVHLAAESELLCGGDALILRG